MRRSDQTTGGLFSYVQLESRVPFGHPMISVLEAAILAMDTSEEVAADLQGSKR